MKYFTKYLPIEGAFSRIVKDENGIPIDYQQEVKLFLCSKDIQVGDDIFSDNGELTGSIIFEEDKKAWEKENPFKVIGEISKDAIWVTEGMEFNEEDLGWWEAGASEERNIYPINKEPKYHMGLAIRCPCCKEFYP